MNQDLIKKAMSASKICKLCNAYQDQCSKAHNMKMELLDELEELREKLTEAEETLARIRIHSKTWRQVAKECLQKIRGGTENDS